MWLSCAVLVLVVAIAVAPHFFAPRSPTAMDDAFVLSPPGPQHLLGTDSFGRDLLSMLIYGARPSLEVAAGATLLGGILGGLMGVFAGYYGGVLEALFMRLADLIVCFPTIIVAMLIVAVFGPGVGHLIWIIGLLFVPLFARLAFGTTRSVKERVFVEAAESMGASDWRVIFRHVIPNAAGPIAVQASLSAATAILIESGLSFLGLGVQPPKTSWGLMIASGREVMTRSPYEVLWPSLALAITILSLNTLGDYLQDRLDPRNR